MPEEEGNGQSQSEGHENGEDHEDHGEAGQGEGQGGQADWRSGLPEDLKTEKSLESFKDVGGLAKSYVEGQKLIGGSVRVPKDDATPEDWAKFHSKMGRPDDVAGYGFVKPEMPEGVEWDEGLVDWFGKTAHDAGLSKAQAGKLVQAWNDNQFSQAHEAQKTMKQELGALQESWGDQFDGRVELGLRGIERLLPAEEVTQLKALMDSSGIGNHPLMLKYAYQVGKLMKEDGYIVSSSSGGVLGAESAKAEIAAINEDQKHAHWNPDMPGHAEAVERMANLFKTAFPK